MKTQISVLVAETEQQRLERQRQEVVWTQEALIQNVTLPAVVITTAALRQSVEGDRGR